MGDFIVDTAMHCFLCLNPIPPLHSTVEQDPLVCPSSFPISSIQHLSRYLKIDMGKVFNEGNAPPPLQLSAKVKKARLKVELCGGCKSWNEKFSRLGRKLEKIEMDIVSCIGIIHSKLKRTGTGTEMKNRPFSLRGSHDTDTDKEEWHMLKGKQQIVQILRSEILDKCSHKITIANSCPRVKVQRLTMKQVNSKTSKVKISSKMRHNNSRRQIISFGHTSPFVQIGDSELKIEEQEPEYDNGNPLQDDDMGNTYSADDDYDPPNEDEESIGQQDTSVPIPTLVNTTSIIPASKSQLKIEEPEPDDPLQDDDVGKTYFADDDGHDPLYEDERSVGQQATSVSVPTLANSGKKRVQGKADRENIYNSRREIYL